MQAGGAAFAWSLFPSRLRGVGPIAAPLDTTNYILGTQTIGGGYGFTDKIPLVETALRISEMGSNILKFSMGRRCFEHYHLAKRDDIVSLTDLASAEPSVRAELDMPFAYYHIWAYPFSQSQQVFRTGIQSGRSLQLPKRVRGCRSVRRFLRKC